MRRVTHPDPEGPPRSAVWAEDASIVAGVAGAVLTLGTALALAWLTFWGLPIAGDAALLLVVGVDLTLVLLAVACHRLAVELARPLEPTPELHAPAR